MADGRFRHARITLTAGLVVVAVAAWVAPRLDSTQLRRADFDREVRAMDADIATLTALAAMNRLDAGPAARLAYRLYQRASLTGRPEDLDAVRTILDRTSQRTGPSPALGLLQATLDVRAHQLDSARSALRLVPELAGNPDARTLEADIDLQRGQYEAAQRGYEAALRQTPTWTVLARLAFLAARRGDVATADRLYATAEDDVSAKEMRAYAWLELQRGQLQFSRGRYDEALAHYRTAGRAYTGYWLVDEYMAELMGATRKFKEAIDLYERAIARAARPDLLQQLGDLYLFMGRPREAKRWHDQAIDGYLGSIRRGEVRFLHHLAGFYADVALDGHEALKWARQDVAQRPNYATEDTLAWALYRSGNIGDALASIDRALASGMVDAHLYYHAATITIAAGRADAGRELTAALERLNPRYNDFHVHR